MAPSNDNAPVFEGENQEEDMQKKKKVALVDDKKAAGSSTKASEKITPVQPTSSASKDGLDAPSTNRNYDEGK